MQLDCSYFLQCIAQPSFVSDALLDKGLDSKSAAAFRRSRSTIEPAKGLVALSKASWERQSG